MKHLRVDHDKWLYGICHQTSLSVDAELCPILLLNILLSANYGCALNLLASDTAAEGFMEVNGKFVERPNTYGIFLAEVDISCKIIRSYNHIRWNVTTKSFLDDVKYYRYLIGSIEGSVYYHNDVSYTSLRVDHKLRFNSDSNTDVSPVDVRPPVVFTSRYHHNPIVRRGGTDENVQLIHILKSFPTGKYIYIYTYIYTYHNIYICI